ncbi:MAG: LLM class flavin-dependent oxidoreductase [Pseudomonadota bacterium]
MKVAISVGSAERRDIRELRDFVLFAEKLGVDSAWSAEGWGTDALTSLAYLAPLTRRIKLGSGILQISARVPAMTAMSALSLNTLSGGRFLLGLGASGPQVVEGLHGSSYEGPLTRLKEQVEICRLAFAGQKLEYRGKYHSLPFPGDEAKALRLDHEPANIPIYLATISPRALRYTGEAADGWLGTTFSPDRADAHLSYLKAGLSKSNRSLNDIDLQVGCPAEIDEDLEKIVEKRRKVIAFSMGAMGSEKTNFYNQAYQRAGFEDDAKAIQALWLAGKRDAAVARVPDEMITEFGAFGDEANVRQRFQKYQDVGINTLQLRLDYYDGNRHFEQLESLMSLIPK